MQGECGQRKGRAGVPPANPQPSSRTTACGHVPFAAADVETRKTADYAIGIMEGFWKTKLSKYKRETTRRRRVAGGAQTNRPSCAGVLDRHPENDTWKE